MSAQSSTLSTLSPKRLILFVVSVILFLTGAIGLIVTTSRSHFRLDESDYGTSEFIDLSADTYEAKISHDDSFLIFVDQSGCITAAGLRAITEQLMTEKNISVYHMMYSELLETSLASRVKHFPSFVIVSSGRVKSWLRADADEDIERFRDYDALTSWLDNYIEWKN